MSSLTSLSSTALATGKSVTVFDEAPTAAGSLSRQFAVESESVLVSLWVSSTVGDVNVVVATKAGSNDTESVDVITFPTISAPTTDLLLKKAAIVMGYVTVTVTFSGACDFVVKARGISVGEASVKLLGQNAAINYTTNVTNVTAPIIPAALADRAGIALHNTSTTQIVYMGFHTPLTDADWEIAPGEKLGLDVAAGVAVYGLVGAGTVVVKVLEMGS